MTEIYKSIKGFSNYEVSDLGNVRNKKSGTILKGGYKNGYMRVDLQKQKLYIHRLVATAFIENPLNKLDVDHINHIRDDNRSCNLQWYSIIENRVTKCKKKNNSGYFSGIYYEKVSKKWAMRVTLLEKCNGVRLIHTERFTDVEDAVSARKLKLIEVYGVDYIP